MYKKQSKMKSYNIIDNGKIPFIVDVNENTAVCYSTKLFENRVIKSEKIIKFKFKDIFIPTPNTNEEKKHVGHCLLFYIGFHKYIFCGEYIAKFKTKELISSFISDIGNNMVPYPYASSFNYEYLFLEGVYFEKIKSPYKYYYDITTHPAPIIHFPKIKKKYIHKRRITYN